MDRLADYRNKRDAARTPEPVPDRDAAKDAARAGGIFVVQEHHARRLHWDFRLERAGVLVSWALPKGVPEDPAVNHLAVHTEDHPMEYANFHGEIPKGEYGAGQVTIWDHGTYETRKWDDREVKVTLHGQRLSGGYVLFATGGKNWMIHRERLPLPARMKPMLASIGQPSRRELADWALEMKWDGVRALAFIEGGQVRLLSRTGKDITATYPELTALARVVTHKQVLLDGEIVAFGDDGQPDFQTLQPRMHASSASQARRLAEITPVAYLAFDVLQLDGRPLTGLPYRDRREALNPLIQNGPWCQCPPAFPGEDFDAVLAASVSTGLEGVVAKRLDSRYEPGTRSGNWLKVKNAHRQEVTVCGWKPGKGNRTGQIGSLLVGVYSDDRLVYCGHVGTGFTDKTLRMLGEKLEPLRRKSSPFDGPVPAEYARAAVWVEPRVVIDVTFERWTNAGRMRAPAYRGLRDDKDPADVVRETLAMAQDKIAVEVDRRSLTLTNLSKVLYPSDGFTKAEILDYYQRVSPVLLPHVAGRPATLKRYPEGTGGESFFQKHAPGHRPDWVRTEQVESQSSRGRGETIDYVVIDDLPTLIWAANLASIELHVPQWRFPRRGEPKPDLLVFDLDPGAPATIVECCRVAEALRPVLEEDGLAPLAKTSGGKGLQLYARVSGITSEQASERAKGYAQRLENEQPGLVVSRMTKSLRKGKVLIDWSQNNSAKTTVAPYSLRARDQPTVSAPVTWEEVAACRQPKDLIFTAPDVLTRIEDLGDLFTPLLT